MNSILESIDLCSNAEIDNMFSVLDAMQSYANKVIHVQEYYSNGSDEPLPIFQEGFFMESDNNDQQLIEQKKGGIKEFLNKIKEMIKKFFKKIAEFFTGKKEENVDTEKLTNEETVKSLQTIAKDSKLKNIFNKEFVKKLGCAVAVAVPVAGVIAFTIKHKGNKSDIPKENREYNKKIKIKKLDKDDLLDFEFKLILRNNSGDRYHLAIESDQTIFAPDEFMDIIKDSLVKEDDLKDNMTYDDILDLFLQKFQRMNEPNKLVNRDNKIQPTLFSDYKKMSETICSKTTMDKMNINLNKSIDIISKHIDQLYQKDTSTDKDKKYTKAKNDLNEMTTNILYNFKVFVESYRLAYKEVCKAVKAAAGIDYYRFIKKPDDGIVPLKIQSFQYHGDDTNSDQHVNVSKFAAYGSMKGKHALKKANKLKTNDEDEFEEDEDDELD